MAFGGVASLHTHQQRHFNAAFSRLGMYLLVVLGMGEANCDVGSSLRFNHRCTCCALVVVHKALAGGVQPGDGSVRVE